MKWSNYRDTISSCGKILHFPIKQRSSMFWSWPCFLNFSAALDYKVLCSSLDGKEYSRTASLQCVSDLESCSCSGQWVWMCGRHCFSCVSWGAQVL